VIRKLSRVDSRTGKRFDLTIPWEPNLRLEKHVDDR
jgi:hypothetical protein